MIKYVIIGRKQTNGGNMKIKLITKIEKNLSKIKKGENPTKLPFNISSFPIGE